MGLVSVFRSCNALSHTLLVASAPTSPVKGKMSGALKMVSSSLGTISSEVASRSFDDLSRCHGSRPLAFFFDFTCDMQFLFMMGERRLIAWDFGSKIKIFKAFQLGPFIMGAVLRFQWMQLFPLCTHLACIVDRPVPFCLQI